MKINTEIEEYILRAIDRYSAFKVDLSLIKNDLVIVAKDLGVDSLTFIRVIADAMDEYSFDLEDKEISKLMQFTLSELSEIIASKISKT